MARYNRKNRAIVSGILVALASIYAVASHFKVSFDELLRNFVFMLGLLFGIVVVAGLAILLIKGIQKIFFQ